MVSMYTKKLNIAPEKRNDRDSVTDEFGVLVRGAD